MKAIHSKSNAFHTVVKEFISPLESHRKGTSMKCSPHTVQYSAAHTVATLNSAFLSFGKALVHRRKKTDKFMLTRLLKVLCSMEKRLHFLHTHNSLRKKIVQVFFLRIFISHCFPPSLYVSTSQQKASQARHWHQLARSGYRHCRESRVGKQRHLSRSPLHRRKEGTVNKDCNEVQHGSHCHSQTMTYLTVEKFEEPRQTKEEVGRQQTWSSPSPRGQWRTEKNGGSWLQNHLLCPNDLRG